MSVRDLPPLSSFMEFDEGAPGVEDKLALLEAMPPSMRATALRLLMEKCQAQHEGLEKSRVCQRELEAVLEECTAPPQHLATFVRLESTPKGTRAMVSYGGSQHLVAISPEVSAQELVGGGDILLSQEHNCILAVLPADRPRHGETGRFVRRTGDGRLVIESQGTEAVVCPAATLDVEALKQDDPVLWRKQDGMALELLPRPEGSDLFLEDTPAQTFEDIGGLAPQIGRCRNLIALHLDHKDLTRKWRLPRKRAALFVGPPGCGKTMIARAFANWVARLSKSGRSRFVNVKPSGLHSMWWGKSEENYRRIFALARQAGESEPDVPVVMFFDEIDSVGSARENTMTRVDSRVAEAFMAELDGLADRGNVLVLAATNRYEALDEAIIRPGRLGDEVIMVPRPNRRAARDIFARHLSPDIPYAANGHGGEALAEREEIIEAAVSRIFAANGDAKLATLTFRSGEHRTVRCADLVSGAAIANILRTAVTRACVREIDTGESGLTLADVQIAIDREFQSAVAALTVRNCTRFLTDLPQDADVVRVDIEKRKVEKPHRYFTHAGA